MKTVFLRLVEADDKASALMAVIHGSDAVMGARRFVVDPAGFAEVPRSPFAYWVSEPLLHTFVIFPPLESGGRQARLGVNTTDDFRFLRLRWAVRPAEATSWWPILKGGGFAQYLGSSDLVIDWQRGGLLLKSLIESRGDSPSRNVRSESLYGRAGLTYASRTQKGLGFQPLPAGSIFTVKGPAILANTPAEREALLGLLNSRAFRFLVSVQMAFGSYEVGVVQRTPVPDLAPPDQAALAALARRAWSLKRSLETRTETSHAFVLPAILQVKGGTLAARSEAWTDHVRAVEVQLESIQAEIDERCFELYGIDAEDRRAITEGFSGPEMDEIEAAGEVGLDLEEEVEAAANADAATLAAELVSWAVGAAFGRFDIRLAIGTRGLPAEPDPFDALPVCSPGMLAGDDGLPLAIPPAGYPLPFHEDAVLVDDPGHTRDLAAAARAVFETVFGAQADAFWQEAAALLDPRDHDLRNWLASGLFEHHLKRHSKSRRKAPILWQFGIPSARYSTWLYSHRLTRDSLFALARDIVGPKLALEERRRASLVQDAGSNPTAKQRGELAAQDAIVEELRGFADEIRRAAPLWDPDLDDGIVLVMAPLWRLVPGHRAWQKELKRHWDELVAGKYDWAHVAMHLWPERVVPKCATDRSLAIAHRLEDVFWVEGTEGKRLPRSRPTRTIDDLVAERSTPAVKAALAELLAVTAPGGHGGRRGRIRG